MHFVTQGSMHGSTNDTIHPQSAPCLTTKRGLLLSPFVDVTPFDYIRRRGWRGLSGARPVDFETLSAHASTVEGDTHRLVSIDGPLWSLELMFDTKGALTHDQLAVAPELAGLDPERDVAAITQRLPFAYLDAVETAPDVVGVGIEAVFGDDPIEDESVVFLANGVNLHYQPAGERSLLRLITNGDSANARARVQRVHARRR